MMMNLRLLEDHHTMEEIMNRDTYEKIQLLRLPGMAKAYIDQEKMDDINELTFDQLNISMIERHHVNGMTTPC